VVVGGYTGTYDAKAHGASGSFSGVAGDTGAVGATLDLGARFTDAPGGKAQWSFSGGTNYEDQSGDVDIVIGKANATVTVVNYSGTYDGSSHTASVTITGVGSDGTLASNLVSRTNAGSSSTTASISGQKNYNDVSGTANINIAQKHITGSFTAADKVYNGSDAATVNGTDLDGAVVGDDVSLSITDATFSDQNVERTRSLFAPTLRAGTARAVCPSTIPPVTLIAKVTLPSLLRLSAPCVDAVVKSANESAVMSALAVATKSRT
jgi:hypothetical protein